jgi:hypothetical protein
MQPVLFYQAFKHFQQKCEAVLRWIMLRARFDLIESDRRSNPFYLKHNLIDPRFTPVGLCSKTKIKAAPTIQSGLEPL